MSEILDNQEVTTETLNNIAIDLGIAEFNGFGENKFGVEMLNNITKDLTGKGILDVENQCSLTFADNILNIATGVIVFDSGAKLRITEPVTVEIDSTSKAYVYVVNDTTINKIALNVTYEPMTTGDFFLICEIEAGVIYDKRVFSRSKVLNLGRNEVKIVELKDINVWALPEEVIVYESDFDISNFNYVVGYCHIPGEVSTKDICSLFLYDLVQQKSILGVGCCDYDGLQTGSTMYLSSVNANRKHRITFSMSEGKFIGKAHTAIVSSGTAYLIFC